MTDQGRTFVSFPHWDGRPGPAVVEVLPGGELRPYPPDGWNDSTKPPKDRLVTAQSIAFGGGFLWILDTASPGLEGPLPGAAKLVKVDLRTNAVSRVYRFGPDTVPQGSYLADIRIHPSVKTAFVSDSGLGAIIVLDLETGEARRVLGNDPSVHADPDFVPTVEQKVWPGRDSRMGNADALALDPLGEYLYYRPLLSSRLYRIDTRLLADKGVTEDKLRGNVEEVAEVGFVDGIGFDSYGNLYVASVEDGSIKILLAGKPKTLFQNKEIAWPARIAVGPDGYLYFTASQLDRSPMFNNGADRRVPPYKFFKFWLTPFLDRPPA